jgi:hypothetical protein
MTDVSHLSVDRGGRVVPMIGALLISVALFLLVFWGVAHFLPRLLSFSGSRWERILAPISWIFIAFVGLAALHRRRNSLSKMPKA